MKKTLRYSTLLLVFGLLPSCAHGMSALSAGRVKSEIENLVKNYPQNTINLDSLRDIFTKARSLKPPTTNGYTQQGWRTIKEKVLDTTGFNLDGKMATDAFLNTVNKTIPLINRSTNNQPLQWLDTKIIDPIMADLRSDDFVSMLSMENSIGLGTIIQNILHLAFSLNMGRNYTNVLRPAILKLNALLKPGKDELGAETPERALAFQTAYQEFLAAGGLGTAYPNAVKQARQLLRGTLRSTTRAMDDQEKQLDDCNKELEACKQRLESFKLFVRQLRDKMASAKYKKGGVAGFGSKEVATFPGAEEAKTLEQLLTIFENGIAAAPGKSSLQDSQSTQKILALEAQVKTLEGQLRQCQDKLAQTVPDVDSDGEQYDEPTFANQDNKKKPAAGQPAEAEPAAALSPTDRQPAGLVTFKAKPVVQMAQDNPDKLAAAMTNVGQLAKVLLKRQELADPQSISLPPVSHNVAARIKALADQMNDGSSAGFNRSLTPSLPETGALVPLRNVSYDHSDTVNRTIVALSNLASAISNTGKTAGTIKRDGSVVQVRVGENTITFSDNLLKYVADLDPESLPVVPTPEQAFNKALQGLASLADAAMQQRTIDLSKAENVAQILNAVPGLPQAISSGAAGAANMLKRAQTNQGTLITQEFAQPTTASALAGLQKISNPMDLIAKLQGTQASQAISRWLATHNTAQEPKTATGYPGQLLEWVPPVDDLTDNQLQVQIRAFVPVFLASVNNLPLHAYFDGKTGAYSLFAANESGQREFANSIQAGQQLTDINGLPIARFTAAELEELLKEQKSFEAKMNKQNAQQAYKEAIGENFNATRAALNISNYLLSHILGTVRR